MDPKARLSEASLLCELLDRPVPVVVSTVSPAGRPQASVVWLERRGDDLAMAFATESAKVRNLTRSPHISIVAVDENHAHGAGAPAYALISGTATILPGEPDLPDRLARRYGQPDGYSGERVPFSTVIMTVERVVGMGPIAGGAMGGWGD